MSAGRRSDDRDHLTFDLSHPRLCIRLELTHYLQETLNPRKYAIDFESETHKGFESKDSGIEKQHKKDTCYV